MDQPFDSVVIRPRERPLGSDHNLWQSQIYQTLRELMLRTDGLSGFVGDGFLVTATTPPSTALVVTPGVGQQIDPTNIVAGLGGVSGLDDVSPLKPLTLSQPLVVQVPLAPPLPRVDLLEVRYSPTLTNPSPRVVLNPSTGQLAAYVNYRGLSWTTGPVGYVQAGAQSTSPLSYKIGIPAATPNAPSPTPGYLSLGLVNVPANAGTVTAGDLADLRPLVSRGNSLPFFLSVVVTTTSQTRPQLSVLAPPGFGLVVVSDAAFSSASFDVYALTTATKGALGAMAATGQALAVAASAPNFGVVDVALQQLLAGAFAAPATSVGLGAPFLKWSVSAGLIPGGVMPASVSFSLDGRLSW
jgi:hypothetical protein